MKRYVLLLLIMCTALTVSAQKRKTPPKRKPQPAKVIAPKLEKMPAALLAGKAFKGIVGQTVVDFFGDRNTYGSVVHDVYISSDLKHVVVRQSVASEVVFFIEPLNYADGAFAVDGYKYLTTAEGGLYLAPVKVGSDQRTGTLATVAPDKFLSAMYEYGKYLSGMSIQSEEDVRNAKLLLAIAEEKGVTGASASLLDYDKKRAEKGDRDSIEKLLKKATDANDYASAHLYLDKLIALDPDDAEKVADKGLLYVKAGNKSEAKRIWKQLRKDNREFADTSSHPFCLRMRL